MTRQEDRTKYHWVKANAQPSRGHLADVTNSPTSKTARKRKKKTSHKRNPKRARSDHSSDSDSEPDKSPPPADSDDETKIKNAGQHIVLTTGLWVHGMHGIFDVEIDDAYDEGKRFENTANKIQGQIRDIEGLLPAAYRSEEKRNLGNAWVARTFIGGLRAQLGNTSTRVRKAAGAAIFNCSADDLLLPHDRTENYRDAIGWRVEKGNGLYSALDVPILHMGWNKKYDIQTCFLNPALMRLYVAVIRGPSAVTAMLKQSKKKNKEAPDAQLPEPTISIPNGDNMERKHSIHHTKPGAIAGAAVLAIWALSGDTSLRSRGDSTGINYEDRFDMYLEILLSGLRTKSKSILNVFREWDRIVFPDAEYSLGGGESDGPSDGGNQRALDALRDEAEADGSGGDEE
ncbi:hypothetical protein R3P38DRAFT_3575753 [Favolaschia claudopus]|uniref:Uncharacterized protein n=1 Tax=Favolaschia claudopus TaxID=2862362 RepID=A0AAW0ALY5_9AGAR